MRSCNVSQPMHPSATIAPAIRPARLKGVAVRITHSRVSAHSKKSTEAVRVLLDEYEQLLSDKAPSTRVISLRILRHLIEWVTQHSGNAGPFQPEMLTQAVVEEYLAYLEQEDFSLHQRTRVKSTLSNFVRFLIEEKRLLQRKPPSLSGLA